MISLTVACLDTPFSRRHWAGTLTSSKVSSWCRSGKLSTKCDSLAVRAGSLSQFQATLSQHSAQFEADKTYTLIGRLRQNVIKTGIRRLSLSYSRISLRDICFKLHLDSEEDAEYIVGKAIRDGVIEGRIVHEQGWMECDGQKSGYGPEVSEVFGKRIAYCLELHNQSVKVSSTQPTVGLRCSNECP